MRLLVVYPYAPYPVNLGTFQRTFHLLRELARLHQVDFFCLDEERAAEPHRDVFSAFCQRVHFQPFFHPPWPRLFPDRLLNPVPTTLRHWEDPAATAAAAANTDLPDLDAHRWKHRVFVIDTPATTAPAYQAQAAALLPAWPGLRERDLHILTRDSAPAFRVRLVGKDGGVKLDQSTPVSVSDLFALIDAMPMRRAEQK